MITIYSDDQRLHHGTAELSDGQWVPCYERPERATLVRAAMRDADLGEIIEPELFPIEAITAVHDRRYVEFLQAAWDLWTAEGRTGDALPLNWPVRGMRNIEPEFIDGKLSYFSFDAGTPITAGTWTAVRSAANVALTGATRLLQGDQCVFSACRPPGHHAAADYFGGYCFLNNAAIAAQQLLDNGAQRVAILDVDYHHGNGTQSIFYERSDVLFVSIHADPLQEYPYFLGHADECGTAAGKSYNANFPLRWGSDAAQWFAALDAGLKLVGHYAPDYLVVSLGVDTFIDDPISRFSLQSGDYAKIGAQIAGLGLPSLYVLEGGYAVSEIGQNVANVLRGANNRPG